MNKTNFNNILEKNSNSTQITEELIIKFKNDIEHLITSDISFENKILDITILINMMSKLLNNENESLYDKRNYFSLVLKIKSLEIELLEAKKECLTDVLTGLMNRRAYLSQVAILEKDYLINDNSFFLILLDIDNFKIINDNYGHDRGDQVLVLFAETLRKAIRKDDFLYRYGGEEFLIIINDHDQKLPLYLKRIKRLISEKNFSVKDKPINISFSAGTVSRKNYSTIDETIKNVDKLLYDAKNNGKNLIICDDDTFI